MAGFRKILVDIDPLAPVHPALAQAADLALRAGATLTVADVVEDIPPSARRYLPPDVEVRAVSARAESLEAAAAKHRKKGATIDTRTLRGRPAIALVREVLRGRYDLLVRYHGRDLRKGHGLGTVDMQLLRKCPCAVWLVGVGEKVRPKRILAAVHPDSDDAAEQDLNRRIISTAADLARLEKGRLTVVTAWAPYGMSLLNERLTKKELGTIADAAHDHAALELDRLLQSAGDIGVPYDTELVEGDPADAIAKFVKVRKIDLVVMGTVGRSGLVGMIMGNTAERVLQKLRASVVGVKPDGFVCPVKIEE
jgi:nucleotide-binding universal stress UspA family protein